MVGPFAPIIQNLNLRQAFRCKALEDCVATVAATFMLITDRVMWLVEMGKFTAPTKADMREWSGQQSGLSGHALVKVVFDLTDDDYRVIPANRKHDFDPVSVFLSSHRCASNPTSEFLPNETCIFYKRDLFHRFSAHPASEFLKHIQETGEIQAAVSICQFLFAGMTP